MVQLDLTSAVILSAVALGLVTWLNSVIFGTSKERAVAIVVMFVAVLTVMLVAWSDFGHTQIVLSKPLDQLNYASRFVVAIMLVGSSSALWQAFNVARSFGTSEAPTVIAAEDHGKLTTAFAKPGEKTVTGNLVAK